MTDVNGDVKKTVSSVQTLNELTVKKGQFPDYQLIHDGTERGDGIFTYEVMCFGHKASASGNSKKIAKQNAATVMLNLIKQNDDKIPSGAGQQTTPEMWWTTLPINVLQDICRREALPHPKYEDQGYSDNTHIRFFTTRCTVGPFTREGEGRTKKQSKHLAARNMIILLSETRESVRELIEELGRRNPMKIDRSGIQSNESNGNISQTGSLDPCTDDSSEKKDIRGARVEQTQSSSNISKQFGEITLEDIKGSSATLNEVQGGNVTHSKQHQISASNLNSKFDAAMKDSSTTPQESIKDEVYGGNLTPLKQTQTPQYNLMKRFGGMTRGVIRYPSSLGQPIKNKVYKENDNFSDVPLAVVEDSPTLKLTVKNELDGENATPSKPPNLYKRLNETIEVKNSSETSKEMMENEVRSDSATPLKGIQTQISPSILNSRLSDMTLNISKASSSPRQSSNYFKRDLMCQRWSIVRRLHNLAKDLNQPHAQKTEEFARSISEELRKILMRLEIVHYETLQQTHDGKFMMALYLSTDPIIVDVGVDVDESNLKVFMYQRVVKALLDVMGG
ncbi:uncharacterized protein LOC107048940 [Diachasma alloeum]|uniref:uncharacterized protein LOC107048940 n=1 Tax=Diachasma alloeum TaxID=454923 RepID=UPI00073850F8|nr:uncharacterized protein LOC107048940 [Diachasma alloeum]